MFFRHYAVPAIAGLTLAPAASGCSQPLHIERDDAIALPAPSATPPQPRDDDAGTTDAGPSDASAGVTPGAHAVFLPYLRLQGLAPPIGSVAPGEFPSPEFPAGTVYVARSESDGAYLTEWDLASATIRKRRRLDVPAHDRFVRLRRIGDAL
ncbi:MAG: hypothetical protein FWD17_14065, partial [Polyangiaceae bacterium]|nr:hypothetical protein [Polyangiaceae bacterium]